MKDKNGYLIHEFLIVIIILSSLVFFLPAVLQNAHHQKVKNFVELLNQDIQYSKLHSSTNIDAVKIRFYPSENYYAISDTKGIYQEKIFYDKSLTIESHLNLNTIDISHGRFTFGGYFYVSSLTVTYKITINAINGDLYVVKV